jgi:hypothetical protein
MNDRELILDSRPDDQERRAAALLAEALESHAPGSADPEALAVARLLAAVGGGAVDDEVSRRRLRNRLTARHGRRPHVWLQVAAAAALVGAAALAVLFSRPSLPPSAELVAVRERAARDAVAGISAPAEAQASNDERAASVLDSAWRERFDAALRSERFAALSSRTWMPTSSLTTETSAFATPAVPTPGGMS